MSCQRPLLPWFQVPWGPLEFRTCMLMGEEKGDGEGKGAGVLRGAWTTNKMFLMKEREHNHEYLKLKNK